MAIELPYGTSIHLPRVHGVHLHHWCCDQDLDVLGWQIREMIRWGSQSVRDNNITGVAHYDFMPNTSQQDLRDLLLEYYGQVFCPALLEHGLFPLAVLVDRNWSGKWDGSADPSPAGLENDGQMEEILTHVNGSIDSANRVCLNLAIFGNPNTSAGTPGGGAGPLVQSLRAWWLAEARAIAEACPLGTWFQAFNGPETTHLEEVFTAAPWDFSTKTGGLGEFNRDWALNTELIEVTMPDNLQAYLDKEMEFFEDLQAEVVAAGHPPERVVLGGVHPYQLAAETFRCPGISDPYEPTTMPENCVCTEYGVARLPLLSGGASVPIGDPDLEYRTFAKHIRRISAQRPRAAYLHSPIDARRADLWLSAPTTRRTIVNWTKAGLAAWLAGPPARNPDAYAAYHLLPDEPHLLEETQHAARTLLDW